MPSSTGKSKENTVSSAHSNHEVQEPKPVYTALQSHHIDRLKWYLTLKEQCKQDTNYEEWRLKMVDWAVYSTFRDCEDQGLVDEAKAMLQLSHREN